MQKNIYVLPYRNRLDGFLLPVPIPVEISREGNIFKASAQKSLGILASGEGEDYIEAMHELSTFITREYEFFSMIAGQGKLRGEGKRIHENLRRYIFNEKAA